MRRNTLFVLVLVAVISMSAPWQHLWCRAASEPAASGLVQTTRVGLLDLARIFTVHVEFKKRTDLLRQAKRQAEIQVQVNEQKRDFFEREARMYLEIYQEIMAEVGKYSDARGIGLVMRFNGDPLDENDPAGIQKQLNKAILYHKGIDITDDIIRIVNAKPVT
ncbi:MAG TPA: hypothetical protein VNH11_20195 [Pirellulales bacterium]|nr:hypothetical protein [Pirellulales bacterium]